MNKAADLIAGENTMPSPLLQAHDAMLQASTTLRLNGYPQEANRLAKHAKSVMDVIVATGRLNRENTARLDGMVTENAQIRATVQRVRRDNSRLTTSLLEIASNYEYMSAEECANLARDTLDSPVSD